MSLDKIIPFAKAEGPREEHWIPLSDLMTGLMMMFMLVAILFMLKVQDQSERMKHVVTAYDDLKDQLYLDLQKEFAKDLPRWKAKLDRDLTIRFEEPDVLFDTGKSILKPQFSRILEDFFPRYAHILASQKYRESIEEIRVEGHTSTIWAVNTSPDIAYFRNMELSQSRTRSVLEDVILLPQLLGYKSWLITKLTANGLSSSHPRLNAAGTEDREASQRVEFRVRTNAEARLGEILKAAHQ